MPEIISRAEANLPPVPSSVSTRSLSSWTGIKVHHTGGDFSSWRAIYDWQVKNRPADQRLVDIGYSFGIADGRVTELRGWTRQPAHDHENSTIGVVFGGSYQSSLPPEEDLAAFVWFCREARLRTGKRLPITGHRDTWPRGDSRYSTCPGDRLYAHIPTLRTRVDNEEDDVSAADVFSTRIRRPWDTKATSQEFDEWLAWRGNDIHRTRLAVAEQTALLQQILAGQSGLTVEQITEATAAGVRAALDPEELADALADELGERIPGATPEHLRAVVADGLRLVLRSGVDEPGAEG